MFLNEEKFNNWFDTDLKIYHCKFNIDFYRDSLFSDLNIHFPESLAKAVVKRKAEFLAGRHCAKKVLAEFGFADINLKIGKNRNPLWPDNIIGSISHCGTHAVSLAANASEFLGLGIDIEDVIKEDTIANVQDQILSKKELALISGKTNAPSQLFTLAFSIKESFFKAAYPCVGKYFDFNAISLLNINLESGTILFEINETLHPKLKAHSKISGLFRILEEEKVVTMVRLKN